MGIEWSVITEVRAMANKLRKYVEEGTLNCKDDLAAERIVEVIDKEIGRDEEEKD